MDIAIQWVNGGVGPALAGVCYLLAACTGVWGIGSAVMQFASDRHTTARDVMPVIGAAAVGTGILYLLGSFVPSLLA